MPKQSTYKFSSRDATHQTHGEKDHAKKRTYLINLAFVPLTSQLNRRSDDSIDPFVRLPPLCNSYSLNSVRFNCLTSISSCIRHVQKTKT